MKDQVVIRKAAQEDLEILLQFEQGVIETERPFDVTLKDIPIRYYDIEEMIRASHIELVVAELNYELVACGYCRIEKARPYLKHAQKGYLGFMYVKPEHRGKGINHKIMGALQTWAIAQGLTELRLDVYVDNNSAITAYEKFGFSKHMIEMRMGIDLSKN